MLIVEDERLSDFLNQNKEAARVACEIACSLLLNPHFTGRLSTDGQKLIVELFIRPGEWQMAEQILKAAQKDPVVQLVFLPRP